MQQNKDRKTCFDGQSLNGLGEATGLFIERLERRRLFSAGALDTSFGIDGLAIAPPPTFSNFRAAGEVVQSDGKVVLVDGEGFRLPDGSVTDAPRLIRFNVDGSLDNSFGTNGVAQYGYYFGTTPVSAFINGAFLQSDGKILVFGGDDNSRNELIERFNSNGSFDTSFNPAPLLGYMFGKVTGQEFDQIFSVAEQPDGKIIAVANESNRNVTVVRLNSDGSLDKSFYGNGGRVLQDVATTNVAVGLDSIGRIDIAAGIFNSNSQTGEFEVIRLRSDGSQDPAFANYRAAFSAEVGPIDPGALAVDGVAIDASGRIIVGGASDSAVCSARFNPDGSPDLSYGQSGLAIVSGSNLVVTPGGMVLQPDGKLVLLNLYEDDNQYYQPLDRGTAVVRLTASGEVDSEFGASGIDLIQNPNGTFSIPVGVVFHPDSNGGTLTIAEELESSTNGEITNIAAVQLLDDVPLPSGATVSGVVFNDANGDGKQETGETGIAGREIYADLNNNGVIDPGEPYAITNSAGQYTLTAVPKGALLIRQVLPAGQRETTPAYGGAFHVTLGSTSLTNINFGSTSTVYLSGEVFNDINGNGKLDTTETGVANTRVYIDEGKTGKYVTSDPSVLTDSSGNFVFTGLAAGSYTLRVVLPTGYTQTDPSFNAAEIVTLASGGVKMNVLFGEQKIA